MRRVKTKSSLYQYLDSLKVLESGNEEAIQAARKEYWRKYKAIWRNQKRKAEKELTTSWDKNELKTLADAARKHKLSKTKFIKTSTLAYIDKRYVVPDVLEVRRIAQLLAVTYNTIQELNYENALPLQTGKMILEKIFELERQVLVSLHNPKTVEQLMIEAINQNPDVKSTFYRILETTSSQ